MGLPSFVSSRRKPSAKHANSSSPESSPQAGNAPYSQSPSKRTIKKATRTRLIFALLTSFSFLVTLVFVILIEVGNLPNRRVTGSIWFIKLDLSHIIPRSVPNAALINSIARTLGLHDFYQVGLWNYCSGYGDDISDCSRPRRLYWFNPVEIILNELLAGATIAIPNDIVTILGLVRSISRWMFALFFVSAPLAFLCMLLTPLSVFSRWATFPIAILSSICALATTAACSLATALFVIFYYLINSQGGDINIRAMLGIKMLVFMWIAAAFSIVGWIVQLGMCCCCASRRDVKIGKKAGRRSAYGNDEIPVHDQIVEQKRQERVGIGRRRWGKKA